MKFQTFFPDLMWESLVKNALLEDLGSGGDITTQALISPDQTVKAIFRARKPGVVAGLAGAKLSFTLLDHHTRFISHKEDGDIIEEKDVIASVEGNAATILGGERTALNLLSHLSGIASETRKIVDLVHGTGVRICCTRKTLPGMKSVQKYAVRAGGGASHRYRLDDAILIKDNHLALCGGVTSALKAAKKRIGHLSKIELEVDRLDQLEEALSAGGADVYLLDNMSLDELRKAVKLIDGRAIAEASGGITPETARDIAETGVNVLSLGWLTHTVKALDIGLDIEAL
ncbi:carboxylating nicotinate-nucleotide diphosphorylase [Swingsia samuiensis]|uniref:Probable nicotinate-nucleotide pyrophosphorylase [carboxylating] n=1 Tax=Swingsia samuiensis TaxID=1293412 RepID=A0A4Y6UN10_9PROT|nr:carboxylating nicotinate-nucleotide diphosphorylase [Swingsia samuiensis]QDH17776.1 carboxylating nicotinate-nucleotide diphosphorylase [Swingsia samuiensis]